MPGTALRSRTGWSASAQPAAGELGRLPVGALPGGRPRVRLELAHHRPRGHEVKRFLLLLLTLAAAAQAARFVSPEGRFAVDAPGDLKTSTHANDTPMGTVEEH